MRPSLHSKLPGVGTNIFTVMSALAAEHKAINLAQGFPDFPCDPDLITRAEAAMRAGHNQYAPMPGLLRLREAIARQVSEAYGAAFDPISEITVSTGATEGLLSTLQALVHPGDEVIVFEPAYDAYIPLIRLAGGTPVAIPLSFPNYRIPWDQVAAALNPRTRAILINSPHNPAGSMIDPADIQQLVLLSEKHPFMVIADEVYEFITFDGHQHLSICGVEALRNRSVVLSSFGKTLHTTGWKVGYALAAPELSAEIRKVHQFSVFATSTPFQHAIASYIEDRSDEVWNLKHFYQAKRDLFLSLMEGSRFEPLPAAGAYFQLMRYGRISDLSDTEFSLWLTRTQGVACIPVSVFYAEGRDEGVVRFCFAKENATLEAAAQRLKSL